ELLIHLIDGCFRGDLAQRGVLDRIADEGGRLDLPRERIETRFHSVAVPARHHFTEDDVELRLEALDHFVRLIRRAVERALRRRRRSCRSSDRRSCRPPNRRSGRTSAAQRAGCSSAPRIRTSPACRPSPPGSAPWPPATAPARISAASIPPSRTDPCGTRPP